MTPKIIYIPYKGSTGWEQYCGAFDVFGKRLAELAGSGKKTSRLSISNVTADFIAEKERVLVLISVDNDLFATHPRQYHDSSYPFNPIQRGLLSADLEYEPPTEADTKTKIEAGNCYWHGEDTTLSWRGSPGFHIETDNTIEQKEISREDMQNQALLTPRYTAFGANVYENNEIIWGEEGADTEAPQVVGACYFENQLIVIARLNRENHFWLVAYQNTTEIASLMVGRYNAIWSFKKDGSAGISFHEGMIYRCSFSIDNDGIISCIFQEPELANINTTIDLAPIRTNTQEQTYIPETPSPLCSSGLGTIASLPINVGALSTECRSQWDTLVNQISTTTTKNIINANGTGEYIIGYAYDKNDIEKPLIAAVELSIQHHYETEDKIYKDCMLVIPVNNTSVGKKILEGGVGYPDPLIAGSIITVSGCDPNATVEFEGVSVTQVSESSYEVVSAPCPGAIATITNCTGGVVVQPMSYTVSPLIIGKGVIANNNTVSVSGGVAPYSYSISGSATIDSTGKITYTSCTAGASAALIVTVTDSCGSSAVGNYFRTGGTWQPGTQILAPFNKCYYPTYNIAKYIGGNGSCSDSGDSTWLNSLLTAGIGTYTYKQWSVGRVFLTDTDPNGNSTVQCWTFTPDTSDCPSGNPCIEIICYYDFTPYTYKC